MKTIIAVVLASFALAACEPLPNEAPPTEPPAIQTVKQAVLTSCSGGAVPAGRCRLHSAAFQGGLCAELTAFTGEGIPELGSVNWPGTAVNMGWSGGYPVESWECAVQTGTQKVQTVGVYDVPFYLWSGLAGGMFEDFHCSASPPLKQDWTTMTPASFRFKNWGLASCGWKPF